MGSRLRGFVRNTTAVSARGMRSWINVPRGPGVALTTASSGQAPLSPLVLFLSLLVLVSKVVESRLYYLLYYLSKPRLRSEDPNQGFLASILYPKGIPANLRSSRLSPHCKRDLIAVR